jgi:hypothetical protein
MRVRKLITGIGGLALLGGLLVVTAAATPAATNITKSQHLVQAKLVGHTAFKAGPTNLTEGVTRGGVPAAYTDDLSLARGLTGASKVVPGSVGVATAAPSMQAAVAAAKFAQGEAQSVKGLNAHDLAVSHGFIVEPPDQGLCAGNGFVVEMVNLNLQVFDANLKAVSGPMVLETFFGQGLAFGFSGGDVTIQGDPRCYWDANTQRWFLSQLVVDLSNNTAQFNLAVSATSSPLGDFNLYSLDVTDNFNPGCPCFGDQPTMGANHDAIFISTNEFSINNPVFNGAVLYTIDKEALADGADFANTVINFIGLDIPTPSTPGLPEGSCTATNGLNCWASVRPSISPTSGERRFGGVEYLLSSLDFAGLHDNRIALWAATNTSSISSDSPSIGISEVTLSSEAYVFPSFAQQKAGTIPLGQSGRYTCVPVVLPNCPSPQPEGQIQTNDDQINNSVFANGLVWGALTTNLPVVSQGKVGIAYFAVRPNLSDEGLSATIVKQSYLVARGNNVYFGAVGMDKDGQGLLSFTLSGKDYFPTSAYATLSRRGAGPVLIAALGQSPQDGFTEYEFPTNVGGQYRPRWGDYTAAVAVGHDIYFASEYIQFPNCSLADWKKDTTCGGTRSRSANWGTSVNKVSTD